jgi:hypothetical protein
LRYDVVRTTDNLRLRILLPLLCDAPSAPPSSPRPADELIPA